MNANETSETTLLHHLSLPATEDEPPFTLYRDDHGDVWITVGNRERRLSRKQLESLRWAISDFLLAP